MTGHSTLWPTHEYGPWSLPQSIYKILSAIKGRPKWGHYQTGSDVWERMLGNEGDQQEKDCYHGDKDASRDPQSVETTFKTRKSDASYVFHRSTRLCAVTVFVGLDMSSDEMQTTSPAEWWTWQYQVTDDEDVPRRHGTNNSRTTRRAWVLPRMWP